MRPRFQFPPGDGVGAAVLSKASKIELSVLKMPGENGGPDETAIVFQVNGCVDAADADAKTILRGLFREMLKGAQE